MLQFDPPARPSSAAQEPFWGPVGELVFAFGHLEQQIDWSISTLLGADSAPKGPTVASQIRNICSRIALIEALYRQKSTDEQERAVMHALIKGLQAALKFRNGVLHGPWGGYDASGRVWRKPRTHAIDLNAWEFEVSATVLREHIQRAQDIGDELITLVSGAVTRRSGEGSSASTPL